ncbi:7940_t:CDS:2 [Paraglomus brasilianum]|uniref:7940_t:CDS:1 n=1 Tax=Paraglomus brasilianum TaxID=144538 RepID=A0A9N9AGT2_9GLOM|nr:7940_t:CDS:2 [Paraglomus brasilianum]
MEGTLHTLDDTMHDTMSDAHLVDNHIMDGTEPIVEEEVLSVDVELAKQKEIFKDFSTEFQRLQLSPGGPLGEYFEAVQALAQWLIRQSSRFPDFPLTDSKPDQDALSSINDILARLHAEIITQKSEHAKTSNVKLREFHWVADIQKKLDDVISQVKEVEATLDGVEESRRRTHDDPANGQLSDVIVTGFISTSQLDEWYTRVVEIEELLHNVDEKINDIHQLQVQHRQYRIPTELKQNIDNTISTSVNSLKSKIAEIKTAIEYERKICRWFDEAKEIEKWIADTQSRTNQLEVPDFINKQEWTEEEQNLEVIVDERRKMIDAITADVEQFKQDRIDLLNSKADDIIADTKDSSNQDDQAVIDLITKQRKNLDDKLAKLTDYITLILSQTTVERYTGLLKNLNDLQKMRLHMQSVRKLIAQQNDAELVTGDVKEVEVEITNYQPELPTDDSALSKAVRQRHSKLLITIQNIRVAVEENKLQMAAYLSPSSPSSPTSAGSDFDRLSSEIQERLESFSIRLVPPPVYMLETDSENDEPERVHGLTCNDDHVEELTERYGSIESELVSFERSIWVEFWLNSERAKRVRGTEVKERINELETKFAEVKGFMELRKSDLVRIKEGREFAKKAHAIQDQFDIVKGKMRRGDVETTTDASIQELDNHMSEAQTLLDGLCIAHTPMMAEDFDDSSFRESFEKIISEQQLVQDWIEEVRIWFREAERIRIWIEQRIDVLENVPQVDVYQEGPAPVTEEQVNTWQKEYEELEHDVEKFDAEDMSRLRDHVKNIMSSDKNTSNTMSPADTMTISITLKTLAFLDQLFNMLKRRANELDCLALRVQWEQEYEEAMKQWEGFITEINDFIKQRSRWKAPTSTRADGFYEAILQPSYKENSAEAQTFGTRISKFKDSVIAEAGRVFDELVDVSATELPEHLLVRQENLEDRDYEYLTLYHTFAKNIVAQKKKVLDYVSDAEAAHLEGCRLRDDLIKEESNPRASMENKYVARVKALNDKINNAWQTKGSTVIYPTHPRHEESENAEVQEGVEKYYKCLQGLTSEVEEALKAYQCALRLFKTAEECKKEAARLEKWIADKHKFLNKRKSDMLAKKTFTKEDVEKFFADNTELTSNVADFESKDLRDLLEKVAALVAEVRTIGTKCVNTDELENMMHTLEGRLAGLHEHIETDAEVLRKKMVESYMNQATEITSWIEPRLQTLLSIANDDTLGEQTEKRLRELISEVDRIETARQGYQAVTARQKELDDLWEALKNAVPEARQVLEQALLFVDVKEKANEILKKIADLGKVIENTDVKDMDHATTRDWHIKIKDIEEIEFFRLVRLYTNVIESLREKPTKITDKESSVLKSKLDQISEAILGIKKLIGKKSDDFEAYQSSQVAYAHKVRIDDLQRWIEQTITNFADATQYGLMVGKNEDQNNNNFQSLSLLFEEFTNELPERMNELESIKAEFQDISARGDIRELQDIIKWHDQLGTSWDRLELATSEMKGLVDKVKSWYDCHGSIYRVETDIVNGLRQRIDKLGSTGYDELAAEVNELDDKIKEGYSRLEKAKVASHKIPEKPGEPLDAQNKLNFKDHHDDMTKRLDALSAALKVALTAAHNASALAAFHAEADRIISDCLEGTAIVKTRHDDLEISGYYALEVNALEKVLRGSIDGYTESEQKLRGLDDQVNGSFKTEADSLIEQNPTINKERILSIYNRVSDTLKGFSDAVALERRELELVRRLYAHAKAARDIKAWIQGCKRAVLDIQVDVTDQELEIADLEEKVARFQPTVDTFVEMARNALVPEADSADIDVPQPEESNPKIKDAVQQRTDRVLDDWNALKDLLTTVRKSLNASRENQEVSRAIKDILMAIGQVKERVLNIESYITGETVIRLPTKEDIDNGERELDEIQAEIDHILQPRIEALDEMLSNLTENATGYLQQRAGIAEALTNLANIIDSKRNQLREANRLSIFGTKADEMEAMISSLLEVIDAASTATDNNLAALPKTELQTRLIELETKYQYYEPKISQELENIRIMAEAIKDDWRVEERLGTLTEQWAELKALANTKKDELKRLLSGQKRAAQPSTRQRRAASNPSSGTAPSNSPVRTVTTRPSSRLTPRSSTSSLRTARSPSPASSRLTKRSVVSPNGSPSRHNVNYRSRLASPSSTPRQTPSPTPGAPGTPRRPPIRLLPHSINNYVPDPNDQLDVEVARIVNACPVKIKVSMVERESGKYMFGEVEPKLCYCRILRSRMVMVRVGGGWAELSKFLVEHANLEQKYIPKARSFVGPNEIEPSSKAADGARFHEAYISLEPTGPRLREGETSSSPVALKSSIAKRNVSSLDKYSKRFGRPSGSGSGYKRVD